MSVFLEALKIFGAAGELSRSVKDLKQSQRDLEAAKIETARIREQSARDRAAIKERSRQHRIRHEEVMAELEQKRLERQPLYDELDELKGDTSKEAADRRQELLMQLLEEI